MACTGFVDAVNGATLRHHGSAPLNASVAGAVKRSLAQSWAFDRRKAISDSSPLMAATLALWGLRARGPISQAALDQQFGTRDSRMIGGRFSRWLQRDDPKKEAILYAIDSGLSDAEACKQVGISMATLRAWMGLDREFTKAVRVARRREHGEVHLWMFNDLEAGEDPSMIPPPGSPAPRRRARSSARCLAEAVSVNALESYAGRLSRKSPDERDVLRQRKKTSSPATVPPAGSRSRRNGHSQRSLLWTAAGIAAWRWQRR